MSTIVCQGLQSCLEPQLTETATLRLKFPTTKFTNLEVREKWQNENTDKGAAAHAVDNIKMTSDLDLGGWSFLQSLSNSTQIPKKAMEAVESSSNYSFLKLSQKSLEICTENLGSETGSDSGESSIFDFSPSESRNETTIITREISRQDSATKKVNSRSFPPPLTTISGSNSLQVRPHREGGRLIIRALEAPSTRSCFEAERSHGRLQLRFLKNCELNFDQKVTSDQEDEESRGGNDMIEYNQENQEEEEEEEEENGVDVKDGIEIGRFQRLRRCKEAGDKGLIYNWEPFWVATS